MAVPRLQHSPRFGQCASSQTVCSASPRIRPREPLVLRALRRPRPDPLRAGQQRDRDRDAHSSSSCSSSSLLVVFVEVVVLVVVLVVPVLVLFVLVVLVVVVFVVVLVVLVLVVVVVVVFLCPRPSSSRAPRLRRPDPRRPRARPRPRNRRCPRRRRNGGSRSAPRRLLVNGPSRPAASTRAAPSFYRARSAPDSYYPLRVFRPQQPRRGRAEESRDDRRLPSLPVAVPVRRGQARRPAEGEDALREVRRHDRDREPADRRRRRCRRASRGAAPGPAPPPAAPAPDDAMRTRETPVSSPEDRGNATLAGGEARADGAAPAARGQALLAGRHPGCGHGPDLPGHEDAHDHRPLGRGHQPRRPRGLAPARRARDHRRHGRAARPRARRTAPGSTSTASSSTSSRTSRSSASAATC